MRHRRPRLLASFAALVLVVGANAVVTAQSPSPESASPPPVGLEYTTWQLASSTSGGVVTEVPSGVVATLLVHVANAGGSGGCNQWTATVTVDGSSITFGAITTTRMACPDPQQTVENDYLTALSTVTDYEVTGTTLALTYADGTGTLTFGSTASTTVEGSWVVTGYNNGSEAVVTPVVGSELTADFATGTVSGSGGCNTFSGGFSVDGASIAIGPLLSTMMACSSDLDTQEAQYLTALQAATTWAISGSTLELRDDSGALQVSLVTP